MVREPVCFLLARNIVLLSVFHLGFHSSFWVLCWPQRNRICHDLSLCAVCLFSAVTFGLAANKSTNSETKQRTLEELDQVFSVPTSVFARRQITEALLYFNKRWPLLPRNTRLDPLYILVDDLDDINNKDDTSDNSPVQ